MGGKSSRITYVIVMSLVVIDGRLPCCRTDDFELLASEIQDKTADDVARYYPVFKKKWKEVAGMRC